jgi:hypothetical protein
MGVLTKSMLHYYLSSVAKQAGDIKIIGTIDNLCFYRMEGNYYVRMKTSLTGKRFWKDQAFAGSRRSCNRFGKANQLASKVYKSLAKEKREYSLYCFLKSAAIALLNEGLTEEEIICCLKEYLPKEKKVFIAKESRRKPFKRKPVYAKACASIFALPVYERHARRGKLYTPV